MFRRRKPPPPVPVLALALALDPIVFRVPLTIVWMLFATTTVVMTEIDRLIGGIMGVDHTVFTMSAVQSPGALQMGDAWATWGQATFPATGALLTAYLIVEALYYVSYVLLAYRAFRAADHSPILVLIVLGLEVLESVFMGIATGSLKTPMLVVPVIIGVIATAKWAAIAITVVWFLLQARARRWIRRSVGTIALGIRAQRIPFVMLVVVGVLGIAYGGATLEQVPDIERAWFGWTVFHGGQFASATLGLAVVAAVLLVLGRARSRRYEDLEQAPSSRRRSARVVPWLIAALVPPVAAILLAVTHHGTLIDLEPLLVFSIGIVALVAVSLALRYAAWHLGSSDWMGRGEPRTVERGQSETVRAAGDLIVGLMFSLAAVGIVRALSAPVFLSLDSTAFGDTAAEVTIVAVRWVFVVAVIASVISLEVLRRVRALASRIWLVDAMRFPRPRDSHYRSEGEFRPWVRPAALGVLAAVFATVILVFAVNPTGAASFGPLGTLTILTGSWSILVGVVVLALDSRKPLEVFRLLRLRSTPVLTIFIVAPLLMTFVGAPAGNHVVESTAKTNVAGQRDDLVGALNTWVEAGPCPMASDPRVIPLIVGAAEGGGIRAATWTVDVYRLIQERRPECAKNVFLSTGASGGSVGLAMFRPPTRPNSLGDDGRVDTKALSSPGALSVTLSGALTSDAIDATIGIRIPSSTGAGSATVWHDRAGLMQAQWTVGASQLAGPYDLQPQSPTGYLVLNSVNAITQCKVVISQVRLVPPNSAKSRESGACDATRPGLGATTDLLDFEDDCELDMNWATAAGLSARFPIVSPAGRVQGPGGATNADCDETNLQLIDGGYVDNPGLGTLSDIAPLLARAIADRNADAKNNNGMTIVPVVMYVSNAPKTDVEGKATPLLPEATIPLTSKSQGPKKQVVARAWLARISSDLEGACEGSDATCVVRARAVRRLIPSGVVLVAPGTEPTITQPLGWALSDVSRTRLNQEAEDQAKTPADKKKANESTKGPPTLGSLLGLFAAG